MAIQVRRGNYADLDTSKLVQAEPFVTLDKVGSDYYVGMTIAPNNVVRLATWDNLQDIETTCEQYRDEAEASKDAAAESESNSEAWAVGQRGGMDVPNTDETYHNNSKYHSQTAESWAVGQRGGTNVPSTDPAYENNSKYYSEQSGTYWGYVHDAIEMVVPEININFSTGQLEVSGTSWYFGINQTTGQLEWAISHA